MLGYVKLSKVQKDMELHKKHTEEERELGHAPVYVALLCEIIDKEPSNYE